MEIKFYVALFGGGSLFGLIVFIFRFLKKRYSFFQYIESRPSLLLLPILCKAEKEGYKFIRTGKDIVSLGHTQGNAWIKPYKCYPNLFSRSAFANENELYIYKIDCVMLLMIKLCRYFKCKKILNIIDEISKFDSNNAQRSIYKIEFFKKSEEFEDDLI